MTETRSNSSPVGLSVFFLIVAAVGLTAAFALTIEKLHALANPGTAASCDFSVIVQCGKNLGSWQGALFGFPNPLLGLIGWPVVAATAAGLLAGARYSRWYWRAFTIVAFVAFLFVLWLFSESVFDLGTLCPWCMVTWIATIPVFYVSLFWTLKQGIWSERESVKRFGSTLLTWSPTVILATFLAEAVISQLQLDWFATLI